MRHDPAPLLLAAFLALTGAGAAIPAPVTTAGEPAAISLPARAPLPTSGLVAAGPVRPGARFDTPGRRAGWIGVEDGSLEAWVWPLKVIRDLQLSFRFRDRLLRGADLARWVEVRPEWTAITYRHEAFTVRQIVTTPIDTPANLILLDVDTSFALRVEVSFQIDLHPMWPGGLGGQYSSWDPELPGFTLGEGSGRHAALVHAPGAIDPTVQPAHSLPDAPTRFAIEIDPETAADHLYPVVVAAWMRGMDSPAGAQQLRGLARHLAADPIAALEETAAHYRSLDEKTLRLTSPEPELDEALRWAKVRLDQGLVCNPMLGCGLVAGYGPSGAGYRPGFAWFFGGDAMINSWALGALGAHDTVRTALEMLARYQRDDGKIMHELSQAAASLDWFEAYPYGYYHAETVGYFLDAVARHVRATGDLAWARRMRGSLRRALAYGVAADTDGDGLMENTVAGLGAVEMGALREARVHQDLYLATLWIRGLEGARWLAAALGEEDRAAEAARLRDRARRTLQERYWLPERGHYAFATTTDGGLLEELTLWSVLPAALGEAPMERAREVLLRVAGPAITTGWGTRMLASSSELYDPLIYNQGTVWPFLTGFAGMAAYRNHQPRTGLDLLRALSMLTRDGPRGSIHEVLSGDRYAAMGASVPHQLFSTSALVTPAVEGLVGLRADLVENRLELSPHLPDAWPGMTVEGAPVGERGRLKLRMQRVEGGLDLELRLTGVETPPETRLAPALPPDARQVRRLDDDPGRALEVGGDSDDPHVRLRVDWRPEADGHVADVSLRWQGGVRVDVPRLELRPGDSPRGPRILGTEPRQGRRLLLHLAGRPEVDYELWATSAALSASPGPADVPGATAAERALVRRAPGGGWILRLEGDAAWLTATVVVDDADDGDGTSSRDR